MYPQKRAYMIGAASYGAGTRDYELCRGGFQRTARLPLFLFLAKHGRRSRVATVFDYRGGTIFLAAHGRCGRADKDDRGWLSRLDVMPTKYRPRLIPLNLCALVKHACDPRSHDMRRRCAPVSSIASILMSQPSELTLRDDMRLRIDLSSRREIQFLHTY